MRRLIASILITLVAFGYCAAKIWNHVPDPTIDFGREIYVAWRVSEGESLYTHLTYINGPLSPYVNATLFKITGTSLAAMKWFNCALALGVLAMVYLITRRIGGNLAAAVCGVSFCVLFGFGIFIRNDPTFNFLTPYSHDLTHGFALALAMILLLDNAIRGSGRYSFPFAGFIFGLILLTKPEVILASSAALGVGIFLGRASLRGRDIGALVATILIPPVVAFILLTLKIGVTEAALGLLGGFKWIAEPRLTRMPLYLWVSGTDHTRDNTWTMIRWSLCWMALIATFCAIGWSIRNLSRQFIITAAIIAGIAGFSLLFWQQTAIPWPNVFRGLPILIVAMLIIVWRRDLLSCQRDPLILMLLVFSLVLIAKIFLAVRITHYGFVLAAPACLTILAIVIGPLARRLGNGGCFVRGAVIGVWAMLLWMHVLATDAWTGQMNSELLTPHDGIFLADAPRANAISSALRFASAQIQPGQTLACVPDGALLNVLLRRVNPTGHTVAVPGELLMFGENRITDDFIRGKPDWILLSHADNSIQSARFFGVDYALPLAAWIEVNYTPVQQFGEKPFTSRQYGILLLRRNDLSDISVRETP